MFSKKDKRLGWIKDKFDPRDYCYRAVPRRIPKQVDLSAFLPAIRDQGNEGSCVGFGVAINLTATAKQLNAYKEWFGPRWIYNGARELEGRLKQEGAYPRDAFTWILNRGCLLEQFWPYTPKVDSNREASTHPNAAKAKDYPILSYVRVVDSLDGICQALADGHLVSWGIPWYHEWMSPKADGILPCPTNLEGGHEVCLYGYDVDKQLLKIANSWTTDWGDKGRCYMNFAYIQRLKQDGGWDAHFVSADWKNGGGTVEEIEYVELFTRDVTYDKPWKSMGQNTLADSVDGKYRWKCTFPMLIDCEARADVKLKNREKIYPGLVRKFKVVSQPEPSIESTVEDPAEGQEIEVNKEKLFVVKVVVK